MYSSDTRAHELSSFDTYTSYDHRMHVVDGSSVISTIAGTGTVYGFIGIGPCRP